MLEPELADGFDEKSQPHVFCLHSTNVCEMSSGTTALTSYRGWISSRRRGQNRKTARPLLLPPAHPRLRIRRSTSSVMTPLNRRVRVGKRIVSLPSARASPGERSNEKAACSPPHGGRLSFCGHISPRFYVFRSYQHWRLHAAEDVIHLRRRCEGK